MAVALCMFKRKGCHVPIVCLQLLQRSSVAEDLYADTTTGLLWLSEEEEDQAEAGAATPIRGSGGSTTARLQQWRQRYCTSLLHHLMARRTIPMEQVGYHTNMVGVRDCWCIFRMLCDNRFGK